ncbi:serine hydrolase domain-containing protein [Roseiterribacter gracilis]|uniref:Penicillin-binding protein n=1 Tax=Roseiterribacter gracilis TaxID=2812848 RepID=A0A8S8XDX2_9PROT|nr:penicillin-binding protein [Rhodospirillales bacterium TMPK1]
MRIRTFVGLAAGLLLAPSQTDAAATKIAVASNDLTMIAPELDRIAADFMRDRHVPGMVFGIVIDGKLAYVKSAGVQDTDSKRPVTADSVFRIASMTKNFTALAALHLRDAGKLQFDAQADSIVPELKSLKYPTTDSPRIRVRDLLHHMGGFVSDDPWGDRQLAMSDEKFGALLQQGLTFARVPQTGFDYSNTGYSIVGRIVSNAAGMPYSEYITQTILRPLGMNATRWEFADVPADKRAIGYRWEDDRWKPEPVLAHGAFGAMGGLHTTANDYAKYVAFLLSAWPPRDGADDGVLKRATIREIAIGEGAVNFRPRGDRNDPEACDTASAYGLGMAVLNDCHLGFGLTHGGGLPGYGSNVLLLPTHGVGLFAFSNLTYAGPGNIVRAMAVELQRAGLIKPREPAAPNALIDARDAVLRVVQQGDILAAKDLLAMNMLLDHDAASWKKTLADLHGKVGACTGIEKFEPRSATEARIDLRCERGALWGTVTLSPNVPTQIQSLDLRLPK